MSFALNVHMKIGRVEVFSYKLMAFAPFVDG
ncbi:hypothetical protein J2S04_000902 [Alicyclobacillus tengchongensis]|uniref:Uncharacterized protein n=1 Tax=Alicyclobacillus tolerans TaxID=90970 RepID=A0ABT9LUV9_9BACL|nr:hypothetical protein [Alicyclobacillus tengchongensis]